MQSWLWNRGEPFQSRFLMDKPGDLWQAPDRQGVLGSLPVKQKQWSLRISAATGSGITYTKHMPSTTKAAVNSNSKHSLYLH